MTISRGIARPFLILTVFILVLVSVFQFIGVPTNALTTNNGNAITLSFSFRRTQLVHKSAQVGFFDSINSTDWITQKTSVDTFSAVPVPEPIVSQTPINLRDGVTSWQTDSGNRYTPGQCTWYAYNRRRELGLKTGSFWGNAGNWQYAAAAAGFTVNNTPGIGAIIEWPGHVAVVEKIDWKNNRVYISEMNYLWIPYNYHETWINNADQQVYIH
jgi:surface antigen